MKITRVDVKTGCRKRNEGDLGHNQNPALRSLRIPVFLGVSVAICICFLGSLTSYDIPAGPQKASDFSFDSYRSEVLCEIFHKNHLKRIIKLLIEGGTDLGQSNEYS